VRNPADLKGKKVGVPEYQLTANVWARAFLSDDYGVNPSDIYWVRGGIENPTRPEKIAVDLPRGVRLDNAPEGETISALLERGEIDGFIAPRPPSLVRRGHPNVGWLFPDPVAVAKDYFERTGLNGLIEDGLHVHSKELIIASQVNVHRFGLAKVLVRINGDSFKELAQKMMEANSSDAIKAFSAALGD
jgi:hypothetical protein